MKLKQIFYTTLILFFLMPLANHAQLVNFTKTDCDGVEHDLFSDLQAGNAVILNFCAGWCAPCRLADPYLEEFYQETCQGSLNIKTYGMLFQDNSALNTDCAFGQQYAADYGLTFPIITDCEDIWYSHYIDSYASFIPLFLVIIPDTVNPENSEVIVMEDAEVVGQGWENLSNGIKDVLEENGFLPGITSTIEELCIEEPFTAELSSNFADGNEWSTGETTQSITVSSIGTYTLTNSALCAEFNESITFYPLPVVGQITILDALGEPFDEFTSICAGELFSLNYTGGTGSMTLETFSWEEVKWMDFNGDINNIEKSTNFIDRFRLRVDNGSPIGQTSCITYSEEININALSGGLPQVEVSDNNPCYFNETIDITGIFTEIEFYRTYTDGVLEYNIPDEDPYQYYYLQNTVSGESVTFNIGGYAGKWINFRYSALDTDSNCRRYSEPFPVRVSDIIELNWPDCLFSGESLSIDNVDYSMPIIWSTGESTPTIVPETSGFITVSYTAIDSGCENTFTKQIEVNENVDTGIVSISENFVCWSGEEDYLELTWVGSGNVIWQMSPDFGGIWFTFSELNEQLQGYFDFLGWPDNPVSGEPIYYPTTPFYDQELVPTYTFRVATGCEDNYKYSNEVSFSYLFELYEDQDGDGYGASDFNPICSPDKLVPGYSDNNLDCDDNNSSINPDITEICDGIDNNCDGSIDEGFDLDNDGFKPCESDCNDNDNTVYPGAVETPDDGIDQDCDGLDLKSWYADTDSDNYGNVNDRIFDNIQPTNYVADHTDCDDTNASVNPEMSEICDGIDNNCDGIIDEGFDADNDGVADCFDNCPLDANKTEPGVCGCGIQDLDDDGDGLYNCEEFDNDDDGVDNCYDIEENSPCPNNVDEFGVSIDTDGDGILDCNDLEINSPCPDDINQNGVTPYNDSDLDGVIDCLDAEQYSECPNDVDVNGISLDSDNDGIPDCSDTCNGTVICHVKKNGTMETLCLTDKELQRHLNHADDNLTGPCPNGKKEQNERTSNNLSIVPNPASDKVTFTVLNNVSKNAELNIYNSLGVLLESFPLKGQKEIKFKIKSMYTSGMYIAEINDQGVIERGKFIINK